MALIQRFEDIEAWQQARTITKRIYELSGSGDFARDYGLKDQIRRSSVSIMGNIAEGFERDGNREFINFLSVAKGSCGETRSHLYVAADQNFISAEDFRLTYDDLDRTGKMIGGFMNYLRTSDIKGRKFR
jgi:four helix bundle protein